MKTCCQDLQDIQCSIPSINERIFPIDYNNDTLMVNTAISVETSLSIGGAQISAETGHIDLPARTLINGVPLLSDAFVSDVINLPTDTTIGGYTPTIEQYFYFFTSTSSTFGLNFAPSGYMINGLTVTTGTPTVDMRAFPFIAPADCVLTSFTLVYVVTPGLFGNAGDGRVSLDLIDKNFNPFFTGISYDIIAPSNNSSTFFQSQFEYYLQKGDSVGVYVSGSAQFNGGVSIYATLGYRIIPPSLLASPMEMSKYKPLRQPSSYSLYNRFPFNNLMNFHRQVPISFEDQLEIIRSFKKNPEIIYGRSLTSQDYKFRSMIPQDGPTVYQDAMAFVLNNLKRDGSFIDFSTQHQNTKQLEKEYEWKGLLFGGVAEDEQRSLSHYFFKDLRQMDYQSVFTEYNMPDCIGYLSFDMDDPELARNAFENFFPLLDHYKFNFVTIRHDGDPNVQSRTGNMLLVYQYVRLFFNIMVDKENGSSVSEDWYVHPDLILSYPYIQKIIDHPENVDNIHSATCIKIFLLAYNE